MLLKTKISKIKVLSEEWHKSRLGKFTSSEIYLLMNDKFWSQGCQTYIYRKVGELLAGKAVINDVETESTRWGSYYEAEAIRKYGIQKGLEYIICQQLITEKGSHFGCTPDGLVLKGESADKLSYNVKTLEVKCPPTYSNFVGLALCETPQHLKEESKQYYWQVLDQMDNCDTLEGDFIVYHPDFSYGNQRIIEFRKMQKIGVVNGKEIQYPLVADLKFLKERKIMAVEKLKELHGKLVGLGKV